MGSKSEDFQVCTGDQRKHAISEGTQTRTFYTEDCRWQGHFYFAIYGTFPHVQSKTHPSISPSILQSFSEEMERNRGDTSSDPST